VNSKNEAIVKAIAARASAAGLHMVAKGVEVAEEFEVLKRLGSHQIQGFIDSEPRPAAEITEFILARNAEVHAQQTTSRQGGVINLIPRWLNPGRDEQITAHK
jgi:sensor c-di-GMP phosphodiesterase-like protein